MSELRVIETDGTLDVDLTRHGAKPMSDSERLAWEMLQALKVGLTRQEYLSDSDRCLALEARLVDFIGAQAESSSHPLSYSLAAGFRTFSNAISAALQGGLAISSETKSTLSDLMRLWIVAMLNTEQVVNPPEVMIENSDDSKGGREVVLTWRKPNQRELEITIVGRNSRYMATWFADDRSLRVQEGCLGLNASDIETTMLWLQTGAAN